MGRGGGSIIKASSALRQPPPHLPSPPQAGAELLGLSVKMGSFKEGKKENSLSALRLNGRSASSGLLVAFFSPAFNRTIFVCAPVALLRYTPTYRNTSEKKQGFVSGTLLFPLTPFNFAAQVLPNASSNGNDDARDAAEHFYFSSVRLLLSS